MSRCHAHPPSSLHSSPLGSLKQGSLGVPHSCLTPPVASHCSRTESSGRRLTFLRPRSHLPSSFLSSTHIPAILCLLRVSQHVGIDPSEMSTCSRMPCLFPPANSYSFLKTSFVCLLPWEDFQTSQSLCGRDFEPVLLFHSAEQFLLELSRQRLF